MTAILRSPQPLCFNSISDFQNRFITNSSLTLLANQQLLILNLPPSFRSEKMQESQSLNNSSAKRAGALGVKAGVKIEEAFRILSEMLHPIGKVLTAPMQAPSMGKKVLFECNDQCSLQSFESLTLTAQRGAIPTTMEGLFARMIASSQLSIKLAKNQTLEIRQVSNLNVNETGNVAAAVLHFHQIAANALPTGHLYQLSFGQTSGGVITHQYDAGKGILNISSSQGIQLSLIRSVDYQSLSSFGDWLFQEKSITLTPQMVIRIHDPALSRLIREYEHTYEPYFTEVSFLLGHLFHSIGKVITVRGGDVECKTQGTCLELRSKKPVTLNLEDGEIEMAICHLENSHLQFHPSLYGDESPALSVFDLPQSLTIYGLSKEDLEAFDAIDPSDVTNSTDRCFHRFFTVHAPVGFIWHRLITNFEWRTLVCEADGKTCYALRIARNPHTRSTSDLKFWLLPAQSVENWILPILNRSSPTLLEEFISGDYTAIQIIMIKVILHYCITGRHYLQNPTFFTAPITEDIMDLVHLSADPEKTYREIQQILLEIDQPDLSDDDFRQNQNLMEIPVLLRMDPAQFDQKKLNLLSPAAKTLMSQLLAIVSKADRSLFMEGLAHFFTETRNHNYYPYLAHANRLKMMNLEFSKI